MNFSPPKLRFWQPVPLLSLPCSIDYYICPRLVLHILGPFSQCEGLDSDLHAWHLGSAQAFKVQQRGVQGILEGSSGKEECVYLLPFPVSNLASEVWSLFH